MSEPTDVVYQRQGEREFLARVYQPDGSGRFPTVVDVHGGVWHIGDRRQNTVIHVAMAAAGILVLALDFRQSQDAPILLRSWTSTGRAVGQGQRAAV